MRSVLAAARSSYRAGLPCRTFLLHKFAEKGYRGNVKLWMTFLIFTIARAVGILLPYKWRRAPIGLLLLIWPAIW